MGDRFFDLANFSVNHELDATQSEVLLEAYIGDVRPAGRGARAHALHVGLPRGDVGRGAVGCPELDFDFNSYAAEHFEATSSEQLASPNFLAALA